MNIKQLGSNIVAPSIRETETAATSTPATAPQTGIAETRDQFEVPKTGESSLEFLLGSASRLATQDHQSQLDTMSEDLEKLKLSAALGQRHPGPSSQARVSSELPRPQLAKAENAVQELLHQMQNLEDRERQAQDSTNAERDKLKGERDSISESVEKLEESRKAIDDLFD